MGGSVRSLEQSGNQKNNTISTRQSQIQAEKNATDRTYNALIESISRSAL